MKKYFLIFGLIGIVLLISSFTLKTNNGETEVDVVVRTIEGHRYIIATNISYRSSRPGGIAIIHAESCNCKKNINKITMATNKEIDKYCSLCMDINCTGCEYHDVHFRNVKKSWYGNK